MANLDSSIILGVKPYQQDDPLERYSKLAGLEANQLTIDKAREERADEQAVRDAYRQSGGDSTVLRKLLTEGGRYKQIQALDKSDLDRRKTEAGIGKDTAETKKKELEIALDKHSRVSSILQTAKDQASYDSARRNIAVQFGPEAVANMPEQFNPADVQQRVAAGMAVKDYLEQQHKAATLAQTQANAPFTAGPGGPVPNLPVQQYEQSKLPGRAPHYDTERGIVVDTGTGVGTPVVVGGQPVGGKPDKDAAQRTRDAQDVVTIAKQALPILDKASSGFIESGMRSVGQAFGATSEAAKADAELKVLAGALVSKMPKMSGPQSDRDVQLYREMAGELGDSTKPIAMRKAALRGLLQLQRAYGVDVPQELLENPKPKPAGRGAVPGPTAAAATATGTGTTLRVPPQGQAAADNETAGMLAQTKTKEWLTENIANNTAALNDPKNKNMKPEHRTLIARELEAYKRALEIQRGGGRTAGVDPTRMSDAELRRELNAGPGTPR